jgi:hypothetical protein
MSPIKQRLLSAIEQTPEPLLAQTLAFLEFLIARSAPAITELPTQSLQPEFTKDPTVDTSSDTNPAFDSDFDPDTDSNAQILADLKTSLHQSKVGQTFPISELWDGINV